jgi:hypothetical protein
MLRKVLLASFLACTFSLSSTFADDFFDEDSQDKKSISKPEIDFHGSASYEAGEIKNGRFNQSTYPSLWIQRAHLHLGLTATYKERLKILLDAQGAMGFSQPLITEGGERKVFHPVEEFTIYDANGSYSWGDVEKPWLQFTAGIFQYKYDSLARHLGEYFYRSSYGNGGKVVNTFDYCQARLLGFKLSGNYAGFTADIILNSELDFWPLLDYSLSGLIGYKIPKLVDIGVGLGAYHILSVDDKKTTPQEPNNEVPRANPEDTTNIEYFSFKSTKFMARAGVDLKFPFYESDFFRKYTKKGDLIIFGELFINDPFKSYVTQIDSNNTPVKDTLAHRTYLMFGINAPTHPLISYGAIPISSFLLMKNRTAGERLGLATTAAVTAASTFLIQHFFDIDMGLDTFSIQFEYNNSPHVNSMASAYLNKYPKPATPQNPHIPKSPWKWYVYAKKHFLDEHMALVFGVGRDHQMISNFNGNIIVVDHEEPQKRANSRNWMLKLEFKF